MPLSDAPAITYLVGLRGTGKTTVGRLLAQLLNVPFHDADEILEQRAGRSIRDIFAAEGEAAFRDREEAILSELSNAGPAVIATGGGVVLREANRQRMRATGRVVWLAADVDTLCQRLRQDPSTGTRRPNLTVGGRVEIEETLRAREPLYRACADLTIDTASRSPEVIARDILAGCSWTSSWTKP